MNLRRLKSRLPVIIALIFFSAWLCAGWLHEHPDASSCQVCKELATSAAEVVRHQTAPEPPSVPERIRSAVPDAWTELFASLPHGRAPPTA